MSEPAEARRYGSFMLGGLHLALPMQALREVLPCGPLIPLPCNAVGLVGGIDLRGVVVPVLDLRLLLGLPALAGERPCVIVMVHGGEVLGLRADSVSDVFAVDEARLSAVSTAGAQPLLFSGCLQVDAQRRVSVLAPAALMQLPQLPRVRDPEPGRQMLGAEAQAAGDGGSPAATAVPMMWVRCGPVTLAIDAMAVHCTLSHPQLRDSVLARGACLGVLDHGGAEVPALDLLVLCGIGSLQPAASRQAFVIRIDGGSVAFLVDAVLDIVPATAADVVALPAHLLPGANAQAAPGSVAPCLLLDSAALRADEEVSALASLGQAADAAAGAAAAAQATASTMLTYQVDVEIATPLEQISEILPYAPATSVLAAAGPVLGVMVNRGRSIPVLSLGQLHAGVAWQPEPSASVLVVEVGPDLVGFAVSGLSAIEPSGWQPELHHAGLSGGRRQLALVGEGPRERMLPVLDLRRLAEGLRVAA